MGSEPCQTFGSKICSRKTLFNFRAAKLRLPESLIFLPLAKYKTHFRFQIIMYFSVCKDKDHIPEP